MSLAMYAAPFDNEINEVVNNDTTNHIGKKRIALNKTQKRYPNLNPKENVNTEKVLSVLQSIHNLPEQQNDLADFSPLPPPQSMGVQSTILREGKTSSSMGSNLSSNTTSEPNDVNQGSTYNVYSEDHNQNAAEDYYKRFIPNYESMYSTTPNNMPAYKFSNSTRSQMSNGGLMSNGGPMSNSGPMSSQDILIEKLNYMIHLLEEQQDERTNTVTEEVVLYSFLGVFIIFIVDAFSRVGKYTR
jgi:hypothetical protein